MSEINVEEVQWLWYPYIPLGKLTILQGNPGEGKTSYILAVIAALTRGDPLPECETGSGTDERDLPDRRGRSGGYHQAEVRERRRRLHTRAGHRRGQTGADALRRKAGRSDPQDSGKADRTRPAAGVSRKRCGYDVDVGGGEEELHDSNFRWEYLQQKGGGQHQYTEETVAGAGKERACRTALAELLQSGSV